jgi:threonine dehydrogenase-like Zn-dependent dehydrogenase
MRALVLEGRGFDHLRVRDVPLPHPGPRQLLARVDAAGICTSLIKLVEQGSDHELVYGWNLEEHPLILGDEGAITLVEVGRELRDRYRPGERFVIQPAVDTAPINHRDRYRNHARGVNKVAVGYTLPGHLAEYILVPEEVLAADCLLPLPGSALPHAHAAMSEPISCVISAQDHHLHLTQSDGLAPRGVTRGLKRGGVTVVLGAGAMGRMHVDLALSYRPRAIVVSDFIEERLERTRSLFGARAEELGILLRVVNGANTDLPALVGELTDYRDADDVIVAVGARPAIESAQALVGRGAVVNLFGGMKKGDSLVSLDANLVHYKEINVTGSSGGSPWDVARTLELMAAGDIDPAVHITRIGDLEHAGEFLQMIKAQQLDGKAVVYPHRRAAEILAVPRWTLDDERRFLSSL